MLLLFALSNFRVVRQLIQALQMHTGAEANVQSLPCL